jgi:hypothetical protein
MVEALDRRGSNGPMAVKLTLAHGVVLALSFHWGLGPV